MFLERLFPGSVVKNLAMVAACGILPVLFVILIEGAHLREREIDASSAEAMRLAESVAAQQTGTTEGIRRVLEALARLPAATGLDAGGLTTIFEELLAKDTVHANFTMLDAKGNVVASGRPFTKANFADQFHVATAIATGRFTAGEYLVGRLSAVPILAFAQPVVDSRGRLSGILTTSLNLARYQEVLDTAGLPKGSVLSLLDRNGLRLLYHPASPTNPLGVGINPVAWEFYSRPISQGSRIFESSDGIRRIYAYKQLKIGPDDPVYMYVSVGIPLDHALAAADAVTKRHLVWLGLAAALSFSLAYLVARFGITARLSRIEQAATRLGRGDLSARTGLTLQSGSLAVVAKTFDAMAQAVQTRAEERRLMLDAARENEERFRQVFDNMADGLAVYRAVDDGRDFEIVDLNRAGQALSQVTLDQAIGRRVTEVFPAIGEIGLLDVFRRVHQSGRAERLPLRFYKDGRISHGTENYVFKLPSGLIVSLYSDTSAQRRAEEALREGELKFRSLYESMIEGVALHEIVSDDSGRAVDYRILDVNPRFEDYTGIGREAALGRLASELYGSGEPPYLDAYARVASGGGPVRFETYFPPLKRHYAISVFSTGPGLFATVFEDISERKRSEAEIVRAKDAAEAASRAKSEFLANMSHEIRTPLNGVLSMLQLLESTGLSAEQDEYLQSAITSSRRLTRLLADILDLSRIEAGKLSVVESEFEIESLKKSILDIFSLAAGEKGIALEFILDPGLPKRLIGDVARLRQILLNLVGNAVKFTDHGRVTITATPMHVRESVGLHVLFTVADTGIGIPEDLIQTVFDPFTQAEGSYTRRFQGAGLGLAIVRRLVVLLHGSLSMESVLDQGTTMYVSLPLKLMGHSAALPGPDAAAAGIPLAGLRVLFAEDDEVNRLAGVRMLEKLGCLVTGASDGKKALSALSEREFDLVLMDIQMPDMDGVEAVLRIRDGQAGEAARDVPVVAVTAYAMSGDKQRFLDAGMDDYIEKPIELDAMRELLERAASGRLKSARQTATPG